MSIPAEAVAPVIPTKVKKKAFQFKKHHLVLLFRQILGDNPYSAKEGRERNKVYEAIASALRDVGIDVQPRPIKLKSEQILDAFEQKKKQVPPFGSEELYGEYEQLLDDSTALRTLETERLTKESEIAINKKFTKEQTAVVQGKAIRDASMTTMILHKGFIYSDDCKKLDMKNLMDRLYAAKKYFLDDLIAACRVFVQNNLRHDSCDESFLSELWNRRGSDCGNVVDDDSQLYEASIGVPECVERTERRTGHLSWHVQTRRAPNWSFITSCADGQPRALRNLLTKHLFEKELAI